MQVETMKGADENDELSFITLAAATANVTRYLGLNEQKDEKTKGDSNPRRTDEQKRADNLEYVEKRLRELRAWEKRISDDRLRRKRP